MLLAGVAAAATPAWTVTGTGDEDADYGWALAAADVDGDGLADVVVGAPTARTDRGALYVYLGGDTHLGGVGDADLVVYGSGWDTYLGETLSTGGDVDGDGYIDVAAGSYNFDNGTGRVALMAGGPGGLDPSAESVVVGPDGHSTQFASALTSAGDFDGDGFADLYVAAPNVHGGAFGYFYRGGPTGFVDAPAVRYAALASFGASVSDAGDVDADGYDDVLVGSDVATAWLLRGSATGPGRATAQVLPSPVGTLGPSAPAGDMDGDGFDDVVLGQIGGGAWVFRGTAAGLDPTPWATLAPPAGSSYFGSALAAGRDWTGDGRADVAVWSADDDGTLWLYAGDPAGPALAGTVVPGADAYFFWPSLAASPDLDGDGIDDLLFGVDQSDGDAFWVVHGGTLVADTETTGPAPDALGQAVGAAGDVDGDGLADLLVGAPDAAEVYVYLSSSGPSATPDLVYTGVDGYGAAVGSGDFDGDGIPELVLASDDRHGELDVVGSVWTKALYFPPRVTHAGRSLAVLGDSDGDGTDDLLVGASGSRSAGAAFYLPGGRGALDDHRLLRLVDPTADYTDRGSRVAAAGDVDGDGLADGLVGDPGVNRIAGEAWLYLGGPGGLDDTADLVVAGGAGDRLGEGLAGADFDGDGYADVALGSPGASGYAGRVDVYGGGPTVATTPTASLPGEPWSGFGATLAAGDDVDGDGFGDLVVTADRTRRVTVLGGSAAGLDATPRDTVRGARDSTFGIALALVGDVDGDGLGDLLVGDGGGLYTPPGATLYTGL